MATFHDIIGQEQIKEAFTERHFGEEDFPCLYHQR